MQNKKQPLTPRNQKQKNDKVKVILRVRPFVQVEEAEQFVSLHEKNTISINKPGMTSYMKFNFIQYISEQSQSSQCQKEMFNRVQQAIECIFDGVDSTIFAYGQTGAGKTFTIIGNCPQNHSDFDFYKTTICSIERGILPRALELIFQEQRKKRNSRITISFFEIYNQKIFDLLSSGMKPLEIRESKSGEISINGLSAIEVISVKQVINYLAEGIKNRATSSTSANIKSSRSHSIFHVKYQKLVLNPDTKEHQVVTAHLRVVDLAGSQKFNVPYDLPQAQKDLRLLQLKSINGSLSKLGHCISALTVQSRTHIPVRDSKLTRILSESFFGSGKIRLIICVSPSFSSMNETSSTLQFADRVKKATFQRPIIMPSIEKKQTVEYQQFAALQQELQRQRRRRYQLQKILSEMQVHPNQLNLLRENQRLKQQLSTLRQQSRVQNNHQKVSVNKRPKETTPLRKMQQRKSLSPRNQVTNKNILPQKTNYQQFVHKDNYVNVKTNNSPNKTSGPKSNKDFQSKSQRMSVDEVQPKKPSSKKMTKQATFDKKIKMFIDKNEIDQQLQEKVKRRLLQIKQEISMGKEWLQSEDIQDDETLWK